MTSGAGAGSDTARGQPSEARGKGAGGTVRAKQAVQCGWRTGTWRAAVLNPDVRESRKQSSRIGPDPKCQAREFGVDPVRNRENRKLLCTEASFSVSWVWELWVK